MRAKVIFVRYRRAELLRQLEMCNGPNGVIMLGSTVRPGCLL
jgi:hypothetical protein